VASVVLLALRMHAVTFRMKRAYWRTLATFRVLHERLRVTAARVDLMRAIHERYSSGCQAEIARVLGCSRVNVCRMVHRLIELGIASQQRNERDRRKVDVTLTARGRFLLRRAIWHLERTGIVQLAYESCFVTKHEPLTAFEAFLQIDDVHWCLHRIAWNFGDTSTLHFDLEHPDD
jgi:DNA-binding MarR family transcriptional regulator